MRKQIRGMVINYMKDHSFPGHDFGHIDRVHLLCHKLVELEKADVNMLVLEAAALLHDVGRDLEKNHPSLDHAEESAKIAKRFLLKINFPCDLIKFVLNAIRSHRYSKDILPEILEGKILQDADRLDIYGAIGIAMTFSYGGVHNRELYDLKDPFAEQRALNDKRFTLDHFYSKLLKIPDTFHTKSAKRIASERKVFVEFFLNQMREEITLIR